MTENQVRPNNQYEDEISLRDLYLIIKSGFWWIIGISLLAAAATFVFFTLRPDVYEAQSTTVITPSSISIANDVGVSFTPQTNVSFEAYRTLATSQPVFEAVIKEAYDSGYTEDDISLVALTNGSNVKQLFGPAANRPESAGQVPLSVNHTVKNSNAELAAFLANRWSEQSLETVKNALLSALNPVGNVTENQLADRKEAVENAEEVLREFNTTNNLTLLENQFITLTSKVANSENRLDEIQNTILVSESEASFLDELLKEELLKTTSANPTSDTFLEGLSLSEVEQFLQSQLTLAQSEYQQASDILRSFDLQQNLPDLISKSEKYQADFSDLPFQIRDLESQIEKTVAEQNLLQEQLESQLTRVTNSDALSDTFLAGLSLSEAQEFVSEQLTVATAQFEDASRLLDAFDTRNNLAVLSTRVSNYQDDVANIPFKLVQLNDQLTSARLRLQAFNTQLTEQLSGKDNKGTKAIVESISQLRNIGGLSADVLTSYTISQLESEIRTLEISITDIEKNIIDLNRELVIAEERLPSLREQQISVSTERANYVQRFERTKAELGQVQSRADTFVQNSMDPRQNRILRDTTPEVLELQGRLRTNSLKLVQLENDRETLSQRFQIASEELPILRDSVTLLTRERSELAGNLQLVETKRDAVRSKLSQFSGGSLDLRENRSLRDTTPEVLALQTQIRVVELKLSQLKIELEVLIVQLEKDRFELVVLQEDRAELLGESERLSLGVGNARAAYQEVIRLEPTIAYISDLLPASAQILNKASVPTAVIGRGRLLPSLLTLIVVGFVTLVFLFLREAITDVSEVLE